MIPNKQPVDLDSMLPYFEVVLVIILKYYFFIVISSVYKICPCLEDVYLYI